MSSFHINQLPHNPFNDFSLAIYQQLGAQQALLNFQHAHRLNVNILLFCCWFAYGKQGRLTKKDIQELLLATHVWHEELTNTLREMRNDIKGVALENPKLKRIRQAILDAELLSEAIEQLLLKDSIIKSPYKSRIPSQQLIDAGKNILMYCKTLKINLDITDCRNLVEILAAVFPQFGKAEVVDQVQRLLQQEEPHLQKLSQQLHLNI